jgi:adenosylhomocysteine nucleosidase
MTARPIGVLSAMPEELAGILELFDAPPRTRTSGRRDYHQGTIRGIPVVAAFSRWGKVAAAVSATQLVVAHEVREVLFFGVAGAVAPTLRVGDVVVADALVQHDLDARPLFPRHEIPLLGVGTLRPDAARVAALVDAARAWLAEEFVARVSTDDRAALGIGTPRVTQGLVVSGDRFVATHAELAPLRAALPDALAVEMEGAAVAQVCHEHDLPFAVLRVISDSADAAAPVDFARFVARAASVYGAGILSRVLGR